MKESDIGSGIFTIERTMNAPVSKVWKAITDKNEMKKWYFDVSDFKPEPGFEFGFEGEDNGVKFYHHCKVIEVVPQRKLSYSWRYRDVEGSSVVTFELSEEGNGTRLKLTHEGLETFPQHTHSYRKESFAQGWTQIIGKNLPEYVESN